MQKGAIERKGKGETTPGAPLVPRWIGVFEDGIPESTDIQPVLAHPRPNKFNNHADTATATRSYS